VSSWTDISRALGIDGSVVDRAVGIMNQVAGGTYPLRAIRHPLGFLCFPIERGERGLCVHAWSPLFACAEPTTSSIHTHSWDLISVVLSGELTNNRYAVTGREPTHRVFTVQTHDEYDELRATPQLVGCRQRASEVVSAGSAYEVPVGQFHATVADNAVTLAISSRRLGAGDQSLGPLDGQTHTVHRERLDPSSSAHAAALIARRL